MLKNITKPFLTILIFSLLIGNAIASEPFVYYLFELPKFSEGCSDCYIPLLVVDSEIKENQTTHGTILITYERDSIWSIDGEVSIESKNINEKERMIKIKEKEYRYQRVDFSEFEKLIRNPLGTIPISRIASPSRKIEIEELKRKYLKHNKAIQRTFSAAGNGVKSR